MRAAGHTTLPLCIDLDGALVASDTLWDGALALLRERPLNLLALPFWLLGGRAAVKRHLAAAPPLDVSTLPYRDDVLAYAAEARAAGREVALVTASTRAIAEAVAAHTGAFDYVVASDDENLGGARKREALVARYGARGFEYVGDSRADRAAWDAAAAGSPVGPSRAIRHALAAAREFAGVRVGGARAWVRAVRIRQWLKNLLVFLPLIAAHRAAEVRLLLDALLAFIVFGLGASAVYVANDLADLASDRRHPAKRARPFAAGEIPIPAGLAAIVLLVVAAFACAAPLPTSFAAVMSAYLAANVLYTLTLKRVILADVVALGGMYALRVIAGAFATSVPVSPWLMGFSLFFFLSLAFLKRYAELRRLSVEGAGATPGRAYLPSDASMLAVLGPGCALSAALVLGLYIQGDAVATLYAAPAVLWALVPLFVYWSGRVWLLAQRGDLDEDAILFAIRDPASYIVAVLAVMVFAAATFVSL